MYLRRMTTPNRDVAVFTTIADLHSYLADARRSGATVGCVPTMGYLHDGHGSLIREAATHHKVVVVSIFVNPTQFGPSEDFERYPRDFDRDLAIVSDAGGTAIFFPSVEEMYPSGARSTIHIDGVTEMLEGAQRPTHFDGVATVVSRLFEAMLPDEAYFGQKDYQQTLVVKRLVATSPLDVVNRVTITVLPTQREVDGLARSSRNVYLSQEDRADAPVIFRALSRARMAYADGERSATVLEQLMLEELATVPRLQVEYATAVDAATLLPSSVFADEQHIVLLVAARLGSTRLIDNLVIDPTA
jgi:pantoate--beta-alanine ligase